MGFLDKLKKTAKQAQDKAEDFAAEHSEQIEKGIDAAAKFADKRTKGKHGDKIQSGAEKAKQLVDKLDDEPEGPTPSTTP